MEEKEYDLLLSLSDNGGSASIVDLVDAGMTTENTAFYDKETYKKNDTIKQKFTDQEGNFNDKAFDSYYTYAANAYNQMGQLQDIKKADSLFNDEGQLNTSWKRITENNAYNLATYYNDNFLIGRKDRKTKNLNFKYSTLNNPDMSTIGFSKSLNNIEESPYSLREIASMQEAKDSETGENLGLPTFWTLSPEPLVLATYDEDTTDENGNVHKKGSYKLNEDGKPYYETLGNRSVYEKQLLNRFDVMTEEGSFIDSINFFDSDDKYEKSLLGSTLKTIALVGPMFLPYVGPIFAGMSVLLQTSSMLGTLGKMGYNIFNDDQSWTLNNLEAFAKQYGRESHTDEAQSNPYAPENIIGLLGEVAAQLKEQRWLVEQPIKLLGTEARLGAEYMNAKDTAKVFQETTEKIFQKQFNREFQGGLKTLIDKGDVKGLVEYGEAIKRAQFEVVNDFLKNQVKKNLAISSPLSKAYMTVLTTQDAYGEALALGIPKGEALIYALGYIALEAAILNTEIGERILPELHANKTMMRGMMKKIFSDVENSLEETKILRPQELIGERGLSTIIREVKEKGSKTLRSIMPSNLAGLEENGTLNFGKVLLGNAVGEAVEETSEELIADLSKEALSIARELKGEQTINMWEGDDWVSRYVMSALGGFLGGGLNTGLEHLSRGLGSIKKFGVFEGSAQDAILAIAQDPEQIEVMDKVLKKLPIGSSTVSFEFDDYTKQYKTTNDYTKSQDYILKKSVKDLINYTATQLKADGAYVGPESMLNMMTEVGRKAFIKSINLDHLRNSKTLTFHLTHFRNLQNKLMNLNADLQELYNSKKDSEKLTADEKLREEFLLNEKEKVKQEILQYTNKEKIYDFAETALFETNEELSKNFKNKNFLTEGHYAEYRFNEKYNKLSPIQKLIAEKEYQELKDKEDPELIYACYQVFKNILESSQDNIFKELNNPIEETANNKLSNTLNELKNINKLFNGEEIEDYEKNINKNLIGPDTVINTFKEFNALNLSSFEDVIHFFQNNVFKLEEREELYNELIREKDPADPSDEGGAVIQEGLGSTEFLEALKIFVENGYIEDDQVADVGYENGVKDTFIQDAKDFIDSTKYVQILCKKLNIKSLDDYKNNILKNYLNQINEISTNNPINYAYAESILNLFSSDNEDTKNLIKEALSNLELKRKSISFNLLEKFINQKFSDESSQKQTTEILRKIHSCMERFGEFDFSQLKFSQEETKTLKDLQQQIILVQALLNAFRKDNADIKNLRGYSPLLNNINKTLGLNKKELLELNSQQVDLLLQDLNDYNKFIDNYLEISDYNLSSKLRNETAIRVKDSASIVQFLQDHLSDTVFGNSQNLSTICPTILNVINNSKQPSFNEDSGYILDKDTLKKVILEQIELDKFIHKTLTSEYYYDQSSNTLRKDKFLEILEKLKPIFETKYKKDTECTSIQFTINKTKDVISFLNYLIRVSAFDPILFYNSYNQTIKDQPNLAAVYEQQIQIHSSLARVVNTKFVNDACSYIADFHKHTINSEPVDYDIILGFSNISLIEGFPGVGKTKACFYKILSILNKTNPNLLLNAEFCHTDIAKAKEFTEGAKENLKVDLIPTDRIKLLTKFYPDYQSYKLRKKGIPIEESIVEEKRNSENNIVDLKLKDSIQPNVIANCPNIIFIDEISHWSESELRLLERASKANNFVVLSAGDFNQLRVEESYLKGLTTSNYSSMFFTPEKISLVMRSENSLMETALEKFQEVDTLDVNKFKSLKVFNYYEDDKNFAGVKQFSIDNFEKEFNSLQSIMKQEDTLFILVDKEEDKNEYIKYSTGNPNIKVYTVLESQGLEADYVIGTFTNASSTNIVYTAFSRAKKGAKLADINCPSIKVADYTKTQLRENDIKSHNDFITSIFDSLDNKELLSKSHFKLQKSLKTPTSNPTQKITDFRFATKKDAEDFLNKFTSFNEDTQWVEKENPSHSVNTTKDSWKIILEDSQYTITVDYESKTENISEFFNKYEEELGSADVDFGIFYDPLQQQVQVPTKYSTENYTQLYSFNTLEKCPWDPTSNTFISHRTRKDNWQGLNKLNPITKQNELTALKCLINIQNILQSNDSMQDKCTYIKNNLRAFSGNNLPITDIEYGILHHGNASNSQYVSQVTTRGHQPVMFQDSTDNYELPGTNLVAIIKDANKNIVLEVNIASLNNPINIYALNKNKIPYSLIKDITALDWTTVQTILANSAVAGNANYENQIKTLYALLQIYKNPVGYYNINAPEFEILHSLRQKEYHYINGHYQYNPSKISLKDFLDTTQFNNDITLKHGIQINEHVYAATQDLKIGNEVITKGTTFIIYSSDVTSPTKPSIQDLLKQNPNVHWFGVTKKEVTFEDFVLNLKDRLDNNGKAQNNAFYGHNANSFYILRKLWKEGKLSTQSVLGQRLLQRVETWLNAKNSALDPTLAVSDLFQFFNTLEHSYSEELKTTSRANFKLIDILSKCTSDKTSFNIYANKSSLYKIMNLYLTFISYDDSGNLDNSLKQEVQQCIDNKELPKILDQTNDLQVHPQENKVKITQSFDLFEIEGHPERPILNSKTVSDDLISLIDTTNGNINDSTSNYIQSLTGTSQPIQPPTFNLDDFKKTKIGKILSKEYYDIVIVAVIKPNVQINNNNYTIINQETVLTKLSKYSSKNYKYLVFSDTSFLHCISSTDNMPKDITYNDQNKPEIITLSDNSKTYIEYNSNQIITRCDKFFDLPTNSQNDSIFIQPRSTNLNTSLRALNFIEECKKIDSNLNVENLVTNLIEAKIENINPKTNSEFKINLCGQEIKLEPGKSLANKTLYSVKNEYSEIQEFIKNFIEFYNKGDKDQKIEALFSLYLFSGWITRDKKTIDQIKNINPSSKIEFNNQEGLLINDKFVGTLLEMLPGQTITYSDIDGNRQTENISQAQTYKEIKTGCVNIIKI